jgi:membrane protein required for colicin V production
VELTWVDWAIVIVLAASVIGGLTQGLFRSVFSLCGLIFGLVLAAWNYGRVAALLLPLVRVREIAEAIGFLLIALLVMAIATIIGTVLSKMMRGMGLGCLDRLAGGVFGFLQGALLITIVILAVVAFFPRAQWLAEAKLPKFFIGACHMSMRVSPAELSKRVHDGLLMMEEHTPEWMHPAAG